MSVVAARNCLLAILLMAAVSHGDWTLAETVPSDPRDAPAILRCEPGRDFSTPAGPAMASPGGAAFAGVAAEDALTRLASTARTDSQSVASASPLPSRRWLFIRSFARTSVYLGLNRRGVAGLHFFQHPVTAASIAQPAPHRGGR